MPGDQEQDPEREQGAGRPKPGIPLTAPGVAPLVLLADPFVAIVALIRRTVARTVHSPRMRHQVESAVFDGLLESCVQRTNPGRLTVAWIRTLARRASFGRKKRGCCTMPLDFDVAAKVTDESEHACDPLLCAALGAAIARLGPRSRVACLAIRATGSIPLAAEASGMSPQSVHRALRRLN